MTTFERLCRLRSVYDGDSLHADITLGHVPYARVAEPVDLGWGVWLCPGGWVRMLNEPIRLAGINAPELRLPGGGLNPAGVAARDYLAELVAPAIAQGLLCGLVSTGFEKYGRALGYITVLGVGSLSQRMLDADHAVPYP